LLALFVWVEHRRRDDAMMPLAMFASRPFVGLTLLTFLLYGALGGLLVLLPYLLIVVAVIHRLMRVWRSCRSRS
jgi:hypothetical protein